MSEELYYIQDTRQIIGNTPIFWKHNSNGYVSDLDDALKVDKEEAIRMSNGRETDVAWPCNFIDSIAKRRVDVQYMHEDYRLTSEASLSDETERN